MSRGTSRLLSYLGLGVLAGAGASAIVAFFAFLLLLDPFFVWLAWDHMHFGQAIGLPSLSFFWGIVGLSLLIGGGTLMRLLVVAIVFLENPSWLHGGSSAVHFPTPSLHNFIALAILILVAANSSRSSKQSS